MLRKVEGDLLGFIADSHSEASVNLLTIEKSADILRLIDGGEVIVDFTARSADVVERQVSVQRSIEQQRVESTARPLPSTAGLRMKAGYALN